nr:MAG TPA: hypothetical protein [Caudoviricetes sp.]
MQWFIFGKGKDIKYIYIDENKRDIQLECLFIFIIPLKIL